VDGDPLEGTASAMRMPAQELSAAEAFLASD
jgi:hypothetical protein